MSDNSNQQAQAHLNTISDLMARYNAAVEDGHFELVDNITDECYEIPLSCEVRSGWATHPSGLFPEEYRILLCTGGPAVQIIGELDKDGLAASATLQHQDWFEPWVSLPVGQADWTALLSFAQQFYFGG